VERPALSLGQRVSTVLWFLLGVGFLLSVPILIAFNLWVPLAVLAVAALLALPVAAVWRLVRDRTTGRPFARRWLTVGVALAFLLTIAAAAPVYYLSALVVSRPLVAPQVTLSNGHKTIIFQGMAHVGSESFYKAVIYDLERALADGYVAYYEGVRPDPTGDGWFSKLMANGGDLNTQYEKLGKVCGLSFQGQYFQLLAEDIREHPERHVAADVSTLDLKREYDRLVTSDKAFAAKAAKAAEDKRDEAKSADLAGRFLDWSQDGDPKHQALGGILCRGLMDIALAPHANKPEDDLDPLILHYRNRMLVDRIVADPRPRIYVNYGFDHFGGMFDLLKRVDPNWKIVSVKWMRVIESPEELHGQL
jgi:hypothetical protein